VAGRESELVTAAKAQLLAGGLRRTGGRLLVVGGAGSLTVPHAGGTTVITTRHSHHPLWPETSHWHAPTSSQPAAPRPAWTGPTSAPPRCCKPGQRTGTYRLGTDELIVDTKGNSTISMEDLAAALLDEAEQPKHHPNQVHCRVLN